MAGVGAASILTAPPPAGCLEGLADPKGGGGLPEDPGGFPAFWRLPRSSGTCVPRPFTQWAPWSLRLRSRCSQNYAQTTRPQGPKARC